MCWDKCPQYFEQNTDDTFSEVVEKFRIGGDIALGTVPDDLEGCVREAADLCPVEIIHVED
jgi:ferredoxin